MYPKIHWDERSDILQLIDTTVESPEGAITHDCSHPNLIITRRGGVCTSVSVSSDKLHNPVVDITIPDYSVDIPLSIRIALQNLRMYGLDYLLWGIQPIWLPVRLADELSVTPISIDSIATFKAMIAEGPVYGEWIPGYRGETPIVTVDVANRTIQIFDLQLRGSGLWVKVLPLPNTPAAGVESPQELEVLARTIRMESDHLPYPFSEVLNFSTFDIHFKSKTYKENIPCV